MNMIQNIDTAVALWIELLRQPALTKFFVWITAWGDWLLVFILAIVFSVLFLWWKKPFYILVLGLITIGNQALVHFTKDFVGRSRPENFLEFYNGSTASFPSGHAAIAVVFYGFLAYVFWREVKSKAVKTLWVLTGILLVILIGFSRIYLGVHFLSDVLVGYLFGLLWLLIGIYLNEKLKQK